MRRPTGTVVVLSGAGLLIVRVARARGARCVGVNPRPVGGAFDDVVAEGAEVALPRLVVGWLEG